MIHEIELKGITNSPSDHECTDGELGTCLNLINEDGALKPIYSTAGDSSLKLNQAWKYTSGKVEINYSRKRTIRFVHKVTHGDEIHIHYIAYSFFYDSHDPSNCGYRWEWYEPTEKQWKSIGIKDKDFNSINAIGNILCFVSEDNTTYGYWNDGTYNVFDLSQLVYSINVSVKRNLVGKEKVSINWDTDSQEGHSRESPSAPEVSSAINSVCNKYIEENSSSNYFKFITFCVCAVKLYDGSYTNVSLPFILPNARHNNKFLVNSETKELDYTTFLRSFTIKVGMTIPSFMSKIIDGVDLFVTQSYSFFNDKKGNFAKSINYTDYELWDDSFDKSKVTPCVIDYMNRKEINECFESATYRLSTHISNDELNTYVDIKRIIGTEQEFALADFKWKRFGGNCSFVYNNRLHIGNINENIDASFFSTSAIHKLVFKNVNITGFNVAPYDVILNERIDIETNDSESDGYTCDAVFKIETPLDNGSTGITYIRSKIQYPIPPLLVVPINNASKLTLFFGIDKGNFATIVYWKKEFTLTQSTSCNMSYFINLGGRFTNRGSNVWSIPRAGGIEDYNTDATYVYNPSFTTFKLPDTYNLPQFIQLHRERLIYQNDSYYWDGNNMSLNSGFTNITEAEFKEVANLCNDDNVYRKKYPNLIRVSEAENPLVFPASNSVQVGSSVIKALASNTHTISEGQFGTAPLYAFTSEGVWALITTDQGTYEARQPVNRDVTTNADGIISTDDAVLYPTKRGIMLIQGTSSDCITDALRGNTFSFTDLFNKDFAKKVLGINGIPESSVETIDFDKFLENASMTFDYKGQRLILYNNTVDYAYVFSFKSKMWGAMECDFKYNVNVYPDSYVVTKDDTFKNIHNDDPTDDTRYLVCTRPLTFDSPERFKTMLTTIVRGYFRNKPGKCGIVLYASNDLFNWFPIATSVDKYLRGIAGTPYKYFRVALTGSLAVEESINGFSSDIQERWQNKLR